MSGILYGVGVGPGAPDLLTLRGLRLIENARHIFYITGTAGRSLAHATVAEFIPKTAREVEIVFSMAATQSERARRYDQAATDIRAILDQDQNVVVLCEGDPMFYGSFTYFFERLASTYRVEVVPGISSPMACAAAAQQPLAIRDDVYTVVPATLPAESLRAHIERTDTVVIMKLGRHIAKLRGLISDLGLNDQAVYVADAERPGQTVCALSDAPENAPYFSMLIVAKRSRPWT